MESTLPPRSRLHEPDVLAHRRSGRREGQHTPRGIRQHAGSPDRHSVRSGPDGIAPDVGGEGNPRRVWLGMSKACVERQGGVREQQTGRAGVRESRCEATGLVTGRSWRWRGPVLATVVRCSGDRSTRWTDGVSEGATPRSERCNPLRRGIRDGVPSPGTGGPRQPMDTTGGRAQ